jgi:hypothetical protein
MAQRCLAGDPPAHRQADEVRFLFLEEIEHADHVGHEVGKSTRLFVILRIAIAARVPRRRLVPRREEIELAGPVVSVPADAVQEEKERSLAGDRQREARRGPDEDGFQPYSALAPEIFTARCRLSLSFFM